MTFLKGFLLSNLILINTYLVLGHEIGEKIDLEKADIVWEIKEGLIRIWMNKQYMFVDENRQLVLKPGHYAFVEDFSDGLAIVKSRQGKYGAIDRSGNLVIDLEWDNALTSHLGYILLARNTGNIVYEDRGEGGVKSYPEQSWEILKSDTQEKIGCCFKTAINIAGNLLAEDFNGNTLEIKTTLINPWYYHPLMKAIAKINGEEVEFVIDHEDRMIRFKTENGEVNFSLPFN